MAITAQMRTEVSQLYVALFGRAPDGEGLGYWVQQLDSGKSLVDVANTMYATTPARAYYPSFLTNGEIINSFYVKVLGRTPDAEGLAFWTGKLNASGATPGSVIAEMISVVANYTGSDAAGKDSQALFNNRVSVAQYYGEANGTINGATTVLTSVTKDAATVTAAKSSIDSGVTGGVNQGQTFTLTVNTDNIAGTSGNDTINAAYDTVNKSGTFNSLDVINGGAGTDTLNIEYGQTINGTITGVEKVFYKGLMTSNGAATGGSDLTSVDASKVGGLTELWFDNVSSNDGTGTGTDMTVSNLTAGQTVGFKGTFSNDGTGAGTVKVAANYGTGATTALVALDGAKGDAGTGTSAGAISLTIAGTKLDTITISGDGQLALAKDGTGTPVKTLNVNGGTDKVAVVTVGTGLGTGTGGITTVNTSGDTKIDLKSSATDLKYTGGAGKDTLILDFDDLTSKDVITFGGGTDRLALSGTGTGIVSSGELTTGATGGYALINAIDVEELQLKDLTKVDASQFTKAGTLVLDIGTGSVQVNKLVDTNKIAIETTGTGSLILKAKVNASGDAIDTGAGTVNVAVAKDASVNIATQASDLTTGTGANFTKLVLTGAGNATYSSTAAGTGAKAVTIDAAGQSGVLTFSGSASAMEKITLGTGKDVLTFGQDATGTGTTGTGDALAYSTYAKTDVVTGFAKGDVIKVGVAATGTGQTDYVDTAAELVKFDASGAASYEQALTQAAAAAGNTKAAWFNWTDGNTYIVQDTDLAATAVLDQASGDLVVKLVGTLNLVTDATLGGITVA